MISSILGKYFSVQSFFEIFHSLHKAISSNGHHQINGVKILLAIKASGQVGLWVGGCMKVVTPWTSEAKPFGVMTYLQVQHGDDQLFNWDLVADRSQKICQVVVVHLTPL